MCALILCVSKLNVEHKIDNFIGLNDSDFVVMELRGRFLGFLIEVLCIENTN